MRSDCESSARSSKRFAGSAVMSAQRVMFTTLAICCAVRCARGVRSATLKICTHARFATTSSAAIRSTLRHRSERGQSLMKRAVPASLHTAYVDRSLLFSLAVGDEDITEAPDGLDVSGLRRVRLNEPA